MCQIDGLNLQIGKNRHYFCYRQVIDLQDVEETRHVLLDIELDFQGLESQILDFPLIRHIVIGDLLELPDFLQEIVHVLYAVV